MGKHLVSKIVGHTFSDTPFCHYNKEPYSTWENNIQLPQTRRSLDRDQMKACHPNIKFQTSVEIGRRSKESSMLIT